MATMFSQATLQFGFHMIATIAERKEKCPAIVAIIWTPGDPATKGTLQ